MAKKVCVRNLTNRPVPLHSLESEVPVHGEHSYPADTPEIANLIRKRMLAEVVKTAPQPQEVESTDDGQQTDTNPDSPDEAETKVADKKPAKPKATPKVKAK